MTVVYTYAATENARSRRKARRAGLQPVAAVTKRCDRVAKALTMIDGPAAPLAKREECGATKEECRNHSFFYKDTNPFGNKIHAKQKMRGKSIPLI